MSMDDQNVWGQAGYREKCDMLRDEIRNIKRVMNAIAAQLHQTNGAVSTNASKLDEVARAVEKLEAEIPAASGGKQ
jgi:chromosome segregation ATPase